MQEDNTQLDLNAVRCGHAPHEWVKTDPDSNKQ